METILKKDMIFDNVEVGSKKKEEALQIISHLCAKHNQAYELRLMSAFKRRERLDSTGFGRGIAIPHARVRGLADPVFAVVRFACPVEWESLDGEPVDLAVVAITPEEVKQNRHLPVLASLSRKLMDEDFVCRLRECTDKNQLYMYMLKEMQT